jgi:hypothetical protein
MIDKIEALINRLPPGDQEKLLAQLDDYKRAIEREKCQESFMAFVKKMWPGFIHGRHHAVLAKKFEDVANGKIKRLAISLPPRHAIMTGMKIPSLRGMVTMADLRVGDFVFGPDGLPVEVLGKSDVFKGRELYRVTTDDGASLVVDGEHLWTVRLDRKAKNWRDYTTEELWLRQEGWVIKAQPYGKTKTFKGKSKDFRAPMLPPVSEVQYPEVSLPIDPYVLGVWLGDGTKHCGIITCHDDDALHTRLEIERRGYKTTDQATKFTFGILDLMVKLRDLGVLKNKHIPRSYLEASASQRRDLLKGLMDTDGSVSKKGQCFFAQSNKDFVIAVAELVRSLGIKASILESEAKIGEKSYGKTWRVSFCANDVFYLPRKEERTLKTKRKFGRYFMVEKLQETGDTQCIKVDREDGLFLAGEGYICTHNSKSEFGSYLFPAWFLGKFPNKKVMQASNTAELAVGFGRKVRNLVMSDQYAEVFPDVKLRQDSKAAGRWSTNHSGEYFACLRRHSLVRTDRGLVPAGQICVGNRLANASGYVTVQEVYSSEHNETYYVAGLPCSAEHPIWTMNRGWVYAKDLVSSDLLCVESISDRMKSLCRRSYGYLEHTNVPPLVQHQESLHKPQQREVGVVRRAWNYAVRALEYLRALCSRHGGSAQSAAYSGSDRCERALQPGKLPVGDACGAVEQQAQQCSVGWQDVSGARQRAWGNTGSDSLPHSSGGRSVGNNEEEKEELRSYGAPEKLGWLRNASAQVLASSGASGAAGQPKRSSEGYMARLAGAAQKILGILVGVRPAGVIRCTKHSPTTPFVNFLTDGDHTFYADGVLTHNCGVGGTLTGRGADICIIDDVHSEAGSCSQAAFQS